jgi:transcriptional regulator with XRE-family HTH domain
MRKSIGYSLREMSEKLGVALSTLDRWERAKIIPKQDMYDLEQRFRSIVKDARNVS